MGRKGSVVLPLILAGIVLWMSFAVIAKDMRSERINIMIPDPDDYTTSGVANIAEYQKKGYGNIFYWDYHLGTKVNGMSFVEGKADPDAAQALDMCENSGTNTGTSYACDGEYALSRTIYHSASSIDIDGREYSGVWGYALRQRVTVDGFSFYFADEGYKYSGNKTTNPIIALELFAGTYTYDADTNTLTKEWKSVWRSNGDLQSSSKEYDSDIRYIAADFDAVECDYIRIAVTCKNESGRYHFAELEVYEATQIEEDKTEQATEKVTEPEADTEASTEDETENATDGTTERPSEENTEGLDEEIRINFDELNSLISKASSYEERKYTSQSWKSFSLALNSALDAREAHTQIEVDSAAELLREAMNSLKLIDRAALDEAIQRANSLDKSKYTSESWSILSSALNDAMAALEVTDQSMIDKAATELNSAIASLKEIDRSELLEEISEAEGLAKEDYTLDSWNKMMTALDSAKALQNSTVQKEIDKAAVVLKNAIASLEIVEPPISSEGLEAKLAQAQMLSENDYTEDSWEALRLAVNKAEAAIILQDQEAIDEALAELENAISSLEKKPTEPTLPDEPEEPEEPDNPEEPDDPDEPDDTPGIPEVDPDDTQDPEGDKTEDDEGDATEKDDPSGDDTNEDIGKEPDVEEDILPDGENDAASGSTESSTENSTEDSTDQSTEKQTEQQTEKQTERAADGNESGSAPSKEGNGGEGGNDQGVNSQSASAVGKDEGCGSTVSAISLLMTAAVALEVLLVGRKRED